MNNHQPPPPSLPKGGGAISGIGESFQPDLFTGTVDFTVPISTSEGRDGFGPALALSYSSGHGNGPFGLGWTLSTPRITRKTARGVPRYTRDDTFMLSGAEDLVPVRDSSGALQRFDRHGFAVTRYRPRIEGTFHRIERWIAPDGDVHWRVTTKDNVVSLYGRTPQARVSDPADPRRTFEWRLEETFDWRGHHVYYEYIRESVGAQIYLRRVLYGNVPTTLEAARRVGPTRRGHERDPTQTVSRQYLFEVLFDYGDVPARPVIPHSLSTAAEGVVGDAWPERPDAFSSFRAGYEIRTARRCERVLMLHHFDEGDIAGAPLVRATEFRYREDLATQLSLLEDVTVVGFQRQGAAYVSDALPPLTFGYSTFAPESQPLQTMQLSDGPSRSLLDADLTLVDLDGNGLPDLVEMSQGGSFVWRNLGEGRFDRRRPQPLAAPVTLGHPGVALGDVGGDGLPDLLVRTSAGTWRYEATPDATWTAPRPQIRGPSLDLQDPNLRLIDLTGDGRADLAATRDTHLLWYPSLGEEGFADPLQVPFGNGDDSLPPLQFSDPRVRLADMTGDGLTDIVLLHDGRIDYWPNMGFGRFGPRRTMSSTPRFGATYDLDRVHLADLDGSGTADLIYIEPNTVRYWINRSGNRWSGEHRIRGTPRTTSDTAVAFADVLGTGTTSIVWSHRPGTTVGGPLRFLDPTGGQKPYLLQEVRNHLGSTTRVRYAPSTRFYVEDEARGEGWRTSLPFPVHVVERVEVWDHVSRSRSMVRYTYHHGYFDGAEREFRGFGRVDQYDAVQLDVIEALDTEQGAMGWSDAALHSPPVLTRTWFHTGVYFDPDQRIDAPELMSIYRSEYFAGDGQGAWLGDPAFVRRDGANIRSSRPHDAYRALKGATLRTEVFSLTDGTDAASLGVPYVVTHQRPVVAELQPAMAGDPAVFFVSHREVATLHYERDPSDPRVAHDLVLQLDDYGNALQSVSVAYGRRRPAASLSVVDQARQASAHVRYAERAYTAPIAGDLDHRTPLLCAERDDELTGFAPTGSGGWFQVQDFVDANLQLRIDREVAPDGEPTSGRERRLLGRREIRFRPDDLGEAAGDPRVLLPRGEMGTRALPGRIYELALTEAQARSVYVERGLLTETQLNAAMANEGGYTHLDGDTDWWSVSTRTFYAAAEDATAAEERQQAEAHFFKARRTEDAFFRAGDGPTTAMAYDDYDLMVVDYVDELGHLVTARTADDGGAVAARLDYRVLKPFWLTDPNGNRRRVAFDPLGMTIAMAAMGKPGEGLGDTLDQVTWGAGQAADLYEATDPHSLAPTLLADATVRYVADLKRFWHSTQAHPEDPSRWEPAFVATIERNTHQSDLLAGELTETRVSFSYSDGRSRIVQQKAPAGNGPVDGIAGIVANRWAGTGWLVYDNKEKPVRAYEPFFSRRAEGRHRFEFAATYGVSSTTFRDPLGRDVAVLHPDGSYEKTVFSAWHEATWDRNDTALLDPATDVDVGVWMAATIRALRSRPTGWETWHERRRSGALGPSAQHAATRTEAHAATPSQRHIDALARPFLSVRDLGLDPNGQPHRLATRLDLDLDGRTVRSWDPRGRLVEEGVYSLQGHLVLNRHHDRGARTWLPDVAMHPLRVWEDRGIATRYAYDTARRVIAVFVTGVDPNAPDQEVLTQRMVFGEQHPEAVARNLRGHVHAVLTEFGAQTTERLDFQGRPVETTTRFALNYDQPCAWAETDQLLGSASVFDPVALEAALGRQLEADSYRSLLRFDAQNRLIENTAPHTPTMAPSRLRASYDQGNQLASIDINIRDQQVNGALTWLDVVRRIDRDAHGRRVLVDHGAGFQTSFAYDPESHRLVHQQTVRDSAAFPEDDPSPAVDGWPGRQVQNLHYTYDAVGNLIHVRDDAQQSVFFRNQRVDPSRDYVYDAAYRIVQASGREHLGSAGAAPVPHSSTDAPRVGLAYSANDGQALGRYVERYAYDDAGNLVTMAHRGTGPVNPGWTRQLSYDAAGDRLTSTQVGSVTEHFEYDAVGNMTRSPHLGGTGPNLHWDHEGRLVRVDRGGGGQVFMAYSPSGQRIRKVWVKPSGEIEERRYWAGFEILQVRNGTDHFERETLHVLDEQHRVALVQTRTIDTASRESGPPQVVRHQISDHLGSSTLELDGAARVLSYEEYTPFGSSAYQATQGTVAPKRYRFSGLERDEETGFVYAGARYLAPWLGRWTSADPLGTVAGLNVYAYVGNRVTGAVDPEGTSPKPPPTASSPPAPPEPSPSPTDDPQHDFASIEQWDPPDNGASSLGETIELLGQDAAVLWDDVATAAANSDIVLFAWGLAVGGVAGAAPGGFLAAPFVEKVTEGEMPTAMQAGWGLSEGAVGVGQFIAGGVGHVGSFSLDMTGVGAAVGVPGHVVSTAVMAEGAADLANGGAMLSLAVGKPYSGGTGRSRWAKILAASGRPNPPKWMKNPHGHHIVMKGLFSRWGNARQYVVGAQKLLKKYKIDILTDPDNLTWAENAGHSAGYARKVYDRLMQAEAAVLKGGFNFELRARLIRIELRAIGKLITDGRF